MSAPLPAWHPADPAGLSTATAHEAAGKIGALPSQIKPVDPAMMLAGPAYPVRAPAGDNLFLHHAIARAAPGDVLVIDCSGGEEFGYWGEVMSTAAMARNLGGLVLTGGVRDSQRLAELAFPVFCAAICIRGTDKDPAGAGTLGKAISIGGIRIGRGDLVLGDADGVLIIPAAAAAGVIEKSRARDADEAEILARLRAGETTLQIYGLPDVGEAQ